jgi:tetratricopeptide (TPR) repeat protein
LYHRWDLRKGEEEFRRSISLNANYSTAHQWYANLLTAAGRFDEAEREMRRAQEIDPLSLIASAALGWVKYYAGDYASAAAQCLRTLELNPMYGLAHLWRGWALQEMDSLDAAVESHRRALAVSDSSALYIASLARSLALRGDRAEARSLLQRLQARLNAGKYTPAYEIAKVHEALGQPDEALNWLERAYAQRAHSMVFLREDPQLERLRSHSRFRELVRQVGSTGDRK